MQGEMAAWMMGLRDPGPWPGAGLGPGPLRPCSRRPRKEPLPQSCGRVVEAHVIDERSEWRTFAEKVQPPGLCLGPVDWPMLIARGLPNGMSALQGGGCGHAAPAGACIAWRVARGVHCMARRQWLQQPHERDPARGSLLAAPITIWL